MSKKGQVGGLANNVIAFGAFVIVLAIIGIVLVGFQDTQTADSVGYNITGDGLSGVETISDFSPVIALLIVGALVFGLVGAFLVLRR